jgi:hypothetical protein
MWFVKSNTSLTYKLDYYKKILFPLPNTADLEGDAGLEYTGTAC